MQEMRKYEGQQTFSSYFIRASFFQFKGRTPALPAGLPECVRAHPTPGQLSWGAQSEDRQTPGIEPGTSRSPGGHSPN